MSFGFMRPLLRRAWWWVFSILIAGPALVLALFGLRAIRVDRTEREQQLREQQTQVARLADATIANAVERLIAQPRDGQLTDEGRFEISSHPRDRGAFKTPTLREITRTAPYMHDGSMATLEEVINFYSDGGRPNPYLDSEIRPRNFTAEEKRALAAFLQSLKGRVSEGPR